MFTANNEKFDRFVSELVNFDYDSSVELSKEYNESVFAFKCPLLDGGLFISSNRTIGIYANENHIPELDIFEEFLQSDFDHFNHVVVRAGNFDDIFDAARYIICCFVAAMININ